MKKITYLVQQIFKTNDKIILFVGDGLDEQEMIKVTLPQWQNHLIQQVLLLHDFDHNKYFNIKVVFYLR